MKPEPSEDLQMRILALLDGTLDEDEVARLDAELCGCREARDLYQQLVLLHTTLNDQATGRSGLEHVPVIPIERLLARQRRRVFKASLLAAAAVLLVSALVLWVRMVPRTPATMAEFRMGSGSVFSVDHAETDDPAAGNELREGSRLRLSQGSIEVNFVSGARCVLEGPADLKLLADNRVRLPEGSAWFEVPPRAVGFTVETAQLTAEDLGTRFGVLARSDQGDQVHVIEGVVAVKAAGADDRDRLKLGKGEAREVRDDGGFRKIDLHPDKFVTALPEEITFVDADVDPATGNTVLDGPGSFGATSSEKTSIDDGRWSMRTRAGVSGGSILEAGYEEHAEPRLRTRFELPKPGRYAIYGYFWNNKEGEGLWDVAFQLGPDGTMKTYSRRNAANLVAVPAQFTEPVPTDDGTGEVLFQAVLGVWDTSTDGSVVTVYIDHPEVSFGNYDQRTWYDGVGFRRLLDE